mgnify:CR=1 FL=1
MRIGTPIAIDKASVCPMAQRAFVLRRVISDFLISVSAVGILLALLVSMDPRVRDEATALMNGQRATQVDGDDRPGAQRFIHTVVGVVRDQSQEHGPLMVMLVFGTGLGLFMFRT